MIEIILHEAGEPDFVVDLFDADVLAGQSYAAPSAASASRLQQNVENLG